MEIRRTSGATIHLQTIALFSLLTGCPLAAAQAADFEASLLAEHNLEPAAPLVAYEEVLPTTNPWLENFSVFAGLDGAKQPQDLGINATLGGRVAANWGHALLPEIGLGVQLGVGYNAEAGAVHVLDQIEGTNSRTQLFTTVGLFQRTDAGWNWALAYDFLSENYYDVFSLGQCRGRVGYQVNDCHELGVWFAVRAQEDQAEVLGTPLELRTINQASLFWRQTWQSTAQTSFWVGAADRHSEMVFLLPDDSHTGLVPVVGATVYMPLNDRLAIYGECNLIMPTDTGTVDAVLGFVYQFGGCAACAPDRRFAPLLPVANNTSFAVDVER
ncbi:MAG: DUF6666 family protein [Pirellulaceae bacterium]